MPRNDDLGQTIAGIRLALQESGWEQGREREQERERRPPLSPVVRPHSPVLRSKMIPTSPKVVPSSRVVQPTQMGMPDEGRACAWWQGLFDHLGLGVAPCSCTRTDKAEKQIIMSFDKKQIPTPSRVTRVQAESPGKSYKTVGLHSRASGVGGTATSTRNGESERVLGSSPSQPRTTSQDDTLFPLLQTSYWQEGTVQPVGAATSPLGSSPCRPSLGQTTSKENKNVAPATLPLGTSRSRPTSSHQSPKEPFFPLLQTTYWEEGTDQPVAPTTSPSQLRVQGLINPRTQQTKFSQQPSAANGQRHDVTDHHAMLGAATISSPVRNASKESFADDPLLFPSPQTLRALEENSRMVWKTYQVQAAKEVLARHGDAGCLQDPPRQQQQQQHSGLYYRNEQTKEELTYEENQARLKAIYDRQKAQGGSPAKCLSN